MKGSKTDQDLLPTSSTAETIQLHEPHPQPAVSPLSPWTHFAVLTAVLAPVALLPYLAVRRHLISLHHKVSEVSATNAALHRDLRSALMETAIRREEQNRLAGTLGEVRREFERFRAEQAGKELDRARAEERTKSDIGELIAENQRMRCVRLNSSLWCIRGTDGVWQHTGQACLLCVI
jgi:hypothetical protein